MVWRLDRRLTAKERRRVYRRDNRFELLLGVLAFLAGVAFFVNPGSSAGTAARTALPGPLDDVWQGMYLCGGLMVAIGVVRARVLLEVPGLWLLATAIAVNAVAIVSLRGPLMAAAALGPLVAAAWACIARAVDLHRNVHLIGRAARAGDLPRRRSADPREVGRDTGIGE